MKNNTKARYLLTVWLLLFCMGTLSNAADTTTPVMLVATERLAGSALEQTVVLAVPDGYGQHLGLIMNRPTGIEIAATDPTFSETMPDHPVFFGGPVMGGTLFAVIRSADPPSTSSVPLMPGLYMVTDEATVVQMVKSNKTARYFTGYMVWGAGELTKEIRDGIWEIQPADLNVVFRGNPQQLWLDLARSRRQAAIR